MSNLDEIQKACRLGDVELLKKSLIQSPELINELDPKLGWAPLYRTVICGHFEASEFLLNKGANPNIQNRLGEAPLHQAADSNQLKIAQFLLKFKADPNIQQNDGDTPLHHCCVKGHLKMAQLLLKHKANPNIQNISFGKTPLHYAAENNFLPIVQALISYNANKDIKDRNEKKPIQYAQNLEIIQALSEEIEVIDKNEIFSEDIPPVKFLVPEVPAAECREAIAESTEELVEFSSENCGKQLESEVILSVKSESLLEPESERVSLQSNFMVTDRNFSFGGDLNKNMLYKWLVSNRLEPLFQAFLHNGYEDLDFIRQIMRSAEPLTLKHLEMMGIKKPGHRVRILALLEDEILRMRKSLAEPSNFNCCAAPIGSQVISSTYHGKNLENWLEELSLGFLIRNFRDSGYDDLDHIWMLMNSNYPITEDVLKNDIKIDKLGYRHRILAKLKEEVNLKRRRPVAQCGLKIEKETQSLACEMCRII
ncbi:unnamed protein product [Blepharisma stoltei]|uniref:SAM domain-containing protein n=1 Tax=Blepharisma stoltei TaxID=1481888 RepID=A0AAU9J9M5_9CILI|nr:unnamed protein product [Blepharisma stoltei]